MSRLQTLPLVALVLTGLVTAVAAQHTGHSPQHHKSAYAELMSRPIRALSSEQIADLRAGRGMGLSLPAELNDYPGPKHAVELAEPLRLTPDQRTRAVGLVDAMSNEAISLGTEIILLEQSLEALFADRKANTEDVRALVAKIGTAQASLRFVHLKYHLAMRDELTPEQIQTYSVLRGYRPAK
jgi:Spy/CpxP family protein refolding chaperone